MQKNENLTAGTRLGFMLIDHCLMTFVAMLFFIPGMISIFSKVFEITHEQTSLNPLSAFGYVGLMGFALYVCKDSLHGRSVGKRAFKLQVVEIKSGKAASPIRCFIRNIFCILWPVEVFVTFVSPNSRIGDRVAGTKVVPFVPVVQQPKINYGQLALALILAFGLMALMKLPIDHLSSKFGGNKVTYVEESLNEKAALETELLFTDSLEAFMVPDVRVYDQLTDNPNLKFISLILRLKNNFLANPSDFEWIESKTMNLLLSKFPKGTFLGQVQYVYEQPGILQIQTVSLDFSE